MKIVISGPAAAFDTEGKLITDAQVLRSVDGLVYDEELCADYLDEPLGDFGIVGGSLRIAFDPSSPCGLIVITEYRAPRKLKKSELTALVEQTKGQWSDGMGEHGFADYEERTGINISVFPIPYDDSNVQVKQIDDGVAVPGVSPLLKAAKEGDVSKLALLLDEGEDIEAKGQYEDTPLMRALGLQQKGAALFLIARGADVNYKTRDGVTCIQLAALFGEVDVLAVMIDAGANINERDDRGATPFMWTANRGHFDALRLLIERGADVNARDARQGHTALMYVKPDRLDIVEYLLKHGADPNIRSNGGRTASEESLWQARSLARDRLSVEYAEMWEAKARFLKQHE